MEAASPLRLVDSSTGEVTSVPDQVVELDAQVRSLNKVLSARDAKITELRNELASAMAVEPGAEDILSVLSFWRVRLMPGAGIVEGSPRWKKVRARLRERDIETKELRFTPLELKAGVVGIVLSDYHMDRRFPHRRDLDIAFADGDRVERLIGAAKLFKRTYGESALAIVDDLAGEGLRWLAERCSCGHNWLQHLRGGGAAQGGAHRCSECACPMFDAFHAKVERFMREQP